MKLNPPIFVLNCKAYLEATGKKAVELAKIADEVSKDTGVSFFIIPQLTDIALVSKEVDNVLVFAPHLDPIKPGAHTGYVLAEAVKEAGAAGVLINHAERTLKLSDIRTAVERARDAELLSMVCANTPLEAKAIASLKPDLMIPEPPELIGTGKAAVRAIKDFVPEAVKAVKDVDPSIIVIVGAGITYPRDAEQTIKMGADGTGGATFIIKAKDRKKTLIEMAKATRRGWASRSQ